MKKFLLLITLLTLVGCDAASFEETSKFNLPEDLKMCKIYQLNSTNAKNLTVLYCPGKTVTSSTYSCGKTCKADIAMVTE